jgi:hypothetical protein
MSTMQWMRPALDWLFDACDPEDLRRAIRDEDALRSVRSDLTDALRPEDGLRVPPGERGDNLIQALIALRLKFPRDEAERKLEKNLLLRRQGGGESPC